MRLMLSISQEKYPISNSTDRVISMLKTDIKMHSLFKAHAKTLKAISTKYPHYSYDLWTIETEVRTSILVAIGKHPDFNSSLLE